MNVLWPPNRCSTHLAPRGQSGQRQPRASEFRKCLFALFALITLAAATSSHAAAESKVRPDKPSQLRVALDDNYPPYIFRDSRGVLRGYLPDLWQLWESRTGVPVELLASDWDKAKAAMANGRADVIDTIFLTPERQRTMDFTAAYAEIPVSIYTHSGIGGIVDLKTLQGFLVGVKAGDACATKLSEAGITSLDAYANYETLVRAAIAGKVKIFCLDEPPANYLLYREGAEDQFNRAFQLYTGEFHRAVHQGDAKTMALLESGFSAITPAELKALRDKWMGTGLGQSPFRNYFAYAVAAAILLASLLVLWVLLLRRAVRQRVSQLDAERTLLRTLFSSIPDLIWLKSKDGVYLSCNPTFEQLVNAKEADIVGKTDEEFVGPEKAALFRKGDQKALTSGKSLVTEEWIDFAANNFHGLFETIKTPMYDANGEPIGVLGVSRDITEHHHTKEKLRASESFFHSMASVSPVGIYQTDPAGRCLYVNARWCEISGLTFEDASGTGWLKGILADDRDRVDAEWNAATRLERPFSLEYRFQRPDGEIVWVFGQSVAMRDDHGKLSGYVGTITDITLQKGSEVEIRRLAFYDALTGLPNRRLLYERLQHSLSATTRNQSIGALMFIDLDNFKTLNDTGGHDKGDLLLQRVAELLVSSVRDVDTVARLGGDEFVVLFDGLGSDPQEAASRTEMIGEKVLAALEHTHLVDGQQHHCTASIGVAIFGHQASSVDDLLKQADLAMYQSKLAGRNTLRFFDPQMQAVVMARAAMEVDLRQAIAEKQFTLHYQPQINSLGQVIGAEALLRWQHPARGLVPPVEFIALAEDSGLILPIGQWVMEEACARLAIWATRDETAHLSMAVNVSAKQFNLPDFAARVMSVMTRSGIRPEQLKLELTEGLLLENTEAVITKMSALKALGVGFSLDDFGTGYSSLTYLKKLPLDQLKIDRSFVRDILTDPNDAAIARTVLALGQTLGFAVIAEGVETEAQRDFLFQSGCLAYQGYFFSKPLPADEFDAYVDAYVRRGTNA